MVCLWPVKLTQPFTIRDANGSNSGQYSVAVSNEHGSVISQPATLVVQVPPVIVLQPIGQEAVKGNNVKLTVRGQGGENLIYTWKKNGVDQVMESRSLSICSSLILYTESG